MKPILTSFFAILLLFLLCACTETAEETTPTVPATEEPTQPVFVTLPPETTPPQPITVYEGAVEDFLLPLEDFSYVREASPQFVMIHFTSDVMANREDPYNMDAIRAIFVDYKVSIHYIISRDGTIYCYIPEDRIAWHAGKGEWSGIPAFTNKMNYHSIGIELAAIGSQDDMSIYMTESEYQSLDPSLIGFTDEQYDALSLLVKDLCQRHQIPLDRDHIIGHEEYAARKADPGELFDWSRIIPENRPGT